MSLSVAFLALRMTRGKGFQVGLLQPNIAANAEIWLDCSRLVARGGGASGMIIFDCLGNVRARVTFFTSCASPRSRERVDTKGRSP